MHLHIKREVLGPLIFTFFVCLPFFLPSFFLSLPLSLPSSPSSFFPNLNLSIQKQPGCANLILTSLVLTNKFLIHLKNIGNYFHLQFSPHTAQGSYHLVTHQRTVPSHSFPTQYPSLLLSALNTSELCQRDLRQSVPNKTPSFLSFTLS